MTYYEVTSCRLAIQVCTGYSSGGRARYRTFSMKGIRPDASDEAIGAILRALAPLLLYPIAQVRKVTKRKIFFTDDAAPATPAITLPAPVSVPMETELLPAEAKFVPELIYPEMPVWEEEWLAIALLLMYLAWAWNLYCLRAGFRLGRAPPVQSASPSPPAKNLH